MALIQATDDIEARIALGLDRARIYGTLARLFRELDAAQLDETRSRHMPELCDALQRLGTGGGLVEEATRLSQLLQPLDSEALRVGHYDAFDESSGKRTAPNEMDQLDGAPQLELTRTYEMADVAGFYRAFGVELAESGQRPDHIAAELEFMHLLAVKEVVALSEEGDAEHAQVCHDASRSFLRDHLGRWAPRLGKRLAEADPHPVYSCVGRLIGAFVDFDTDLIDASGAPVHRIEPA